AKRMYLRADEVTLHHPVTNQPMKFNAVSEFADDAGPALRAALIETAETNAYRLIHGASDGWPGWYVDRLGDFALSQSGRAPPGRAHGRRAWTCQKNIWNGASATLL